MQATGEDHVWLDATMIDDFQHHFPTIWFSCLRVDLDPTEEWLPVAPAAHYLSGGVVTDLDGATTLDHLWACGEVACSGVHGANRLASNSLLDGLVFGRRVVEAILGGQADGGVDGRDDRCARPPERRRARSRSRRAPEGRRRPTPTRCAARCSA